MARSLLVLACVLALSHGNDEWGYYSLSGVTNSSSGLVGTLDFHQGNETFPFGEIIQQIKLEVIFIDDQSLRVKLSDPAQARWEVPGIVSPDLPNDVTSARAYEVIYSGEEEAFRLTVSRIQSKLQNPRVWDSNSLFFSDQYIQWGTTFPAQTNIYGLGERVGPLRYDLSSEQTYSFLASDHFSPPKLPLYGSHPYHMEVRSDADGYSETHGAFLLNSNPMDAVLAPDALTYKTIGGIIDLFVFLGPNPHSVTQQYQQVIGTPFLPPLWSLGYHQCRWGYDNYTEIQAVIDKFDEHELPADVFWVDIDYMQRWKMFTTDPALFPKDEMKTLVDGLHASGRRFVPIIDPGVRIEEGYPAYLDGLEKHVFVRDPEGVNYTIGKVWPGLVHYPDWTHPNTSDYWALHIEQFHADIGVDGLWTDMNEVASFCDGRCILTDKDDGAGAADESLFVCNCTERFDTGSWDDPPYQPLDTVRDDCRSVTGDPVHGLDCSTISMASQHHLSSEYNLHNMYGHLEALTTAAALQRATNERPFVLTRSSFPSTGHHTAHWLGDNSASWFDLWKSIPGVLNMNLFGIPLVGADICGFAGTTTPELCTRWMQAGAFYPFMRNHNTLGAPGQEPYALGEAVLAASQSVLALRYSLISYWYTHFFAAHTDGGAVARALFYEFPNDHHTYGVGNQTMVGPALLVSPVLSEGSRSVQAYFPRDVDWYDLNTGKLTIDHLEETRHLELDAPLDKLNVHVRGGQVVPMQAPNRTTASQQGAPYHLLVALNYAGQEAVAGRMRAVGDLVVDDGVSLDTVETGAYSALSFTAVDHVESGEAPGFDVTVNVRSAGKESITLASVAVLGWNCPKACVQAEAANTSLTLAAAATPVLPTDAMHFSISPAVVPTDLDSDAVFSLRCTCSPPATDGLSTGTIIGVSLAAAVALLSCFVACAYYRRKRQYQGEAYEPLVNEFSH